MERSWVSWTRSGIMAYRRNNLSVWLVDICFGGEIVYLRESFPTPRALLSYMFTFSVILMILPGAITANSNTVAQYLTYITINDSEDPEKLHPNAYFRGSDFWSLRCYTLLVLWIITIYHILSNGLAYIINLTLAAVKVASLFVYIAVAIRTGINSSGNWSRPFDGSILTRSTFSRAMLPILYAYEGWNNLNYTLDEFKNPERLIVSNSASVVFVTFFYLLVNIVYINLIPFDSADLRKMFVGRSKFTVAQFSFGATASMVFIGARIINTAARRNYFPGASYIVWRCGDSPPFDTPWKALLLQGIYCSVIIIFYPSNDPFAFLMSASEHCAWVFYGATAAGLVWMSYNRRAREGFRVYLDLPVFVAFFTLLIIITPFLSPQDMLPYPYWAPFVMSFLLIALGGVFWKLLDIQQTEPLYETITGSNDLLMQDI